MKKNKNMLMVYIAMETAITIMTIIQGNYIAATGWGFLMLTNVGILIETLEKEKNGKLDK